MHLVLVAVSLVLVEPVEVPHTICTGQSGHFLNPFQVQCAVVDGLWGSTNIHLGSIGPGG